MKRNFELSDDKASVSLASPVGKDSRQNSFKDVSDSGNCSQNSLNSNSIFHSSPTFSKTVNGQCKTKIGKLLPSSPKDGITSLSFAINNDRLLLATSWDKSTCLYDIESERLLSSFELQGGLLDGTFSEPNLGFAGGIDGRLYRLELNRNIVSIVGTHEDAIKCVSFNSKHNLLMSAGWDNTMKIWDFRSKLSCTNNIELRGKAYSLDTSQNKIIIAEAERRISVYDIRNLKIPFQHRRSPLSLATRCIRINPQCDGFVLSSIEGRIAVDTFDTKQANSDNKFILKAHYREDQGKDYVYPVNSLCFDKSNNDLLSGGGDGVVCRWDIKRQEKVKSIPGYPTSISDIAVTTDGRFLAVASSYTWEEGNKAHPPDQIYICDSQNYLQPDLDNKPNRLLSLTPQASPKS